jgi:hypothetical protein
VRACSPPGPGRAGGASRERAARRGGCGRRLGCVSRLGLSRKNSARSQAQAPSRGFRYAGRGLPGRRASYVHARTDRRRPGAVPGRLISRSRG